MTKKTELKHETFAITFKWLRQRGACYASLTALDAARLLPITISTDPDENVDLAVELVQTPAWPPPDPFNRRFEPITRWLCWLRDQMPIRASRADLHDAGSQYDRGMILEQVDHLPQFGEHDPTLLAQMLACLSGSRPRSA